MSESESEYESQSDPEAEDKLPTGSADTTIVCNKQKVEEWKWNPSCSSPFQPTRKLFCRVPGTKGEVTGGLLEEVCVCGD
jgi:hypothetical protein